MGVEGLVLGAGFGIEVLTQDGGMIIGLRGWRPWMVLGVLFLLAAFGVLVGFSVGRRVGKVEGLAAARRKKAGTGP